MIDVPLNEDGTDQAFYFGKRLPLNIVYCDHLKRCKETASYLSQISIISSGPLPWRMGPNFEGKPITEDSLQMARRYIMEPCITPLGGEAFHYWYTRWIEWVRDLDRICPANKRVGVVTHNRNIQALYATGPDGRFNYEKYDCAGPDFCSAHLYHKGYIAPWNGNLVNGLYMIRHSETEFGT